MQAQKTSPTAENPSLSPLNVRLPRLSPSALSLSLSSSSHTDTHSHRRLLHRRAHRLPPPSPSSSLALDLHPINTTRPSLSTHTTLVSLRLPTSIVTAFNRRLGQHRHRQQQSSAATLVLSAEPQMAEPASVQPSPSQTVATRRRCLRLHFRRAVASQIRRDSRQQAVVPVFFFGRVAAVENVAFGPSLLLSLRRRPNDSRAAAPPPLCRLDSSSVTAPFSSPRRNEQQLPPSSSPSLLNPTPSQIQLDSPPPVAILPGEQQPPKGRRCLTRTVPSSLFLLGLQQ